MAIWQSSFSLWILFTEIAQFSIFYIIFDWGDISLWQMVKVETMKKSLPALSGQSFIEKLEQIWWSWKWRWWNVVIQIQFNNTLESNASNQNVGQDTQARRIEDGYLALKLCREIFDCRKIFI